MEGKFLVYPTEIHTILRTQSECFLLDSMYMPFIKDFNMGVVWTSTPMALSLPALWESFEYDRPTDQETDTRGHREVTPPVAVPFLT